MKRYLRGKWIPVLCCLFLAGGAYAQPRQVLPSDLEGKKVMVRIYRDWRKDPALYNLVSSEIRDSQFAIRSGNMSQTAILAIMADDQASPEIAKVFEGVHWIKAIESKDGLKIYATGRISLVGFPGRSVKETGCLIMDARGEPIENAAATLTYFAGEDEAAPRIVIQDLKTGPGGKFCFSECDGLFQNMLCRIEHPGYGIVEMRGSTMSFVMNKRFHLPLVRTDTPAAERALRGVVTTPEGQPCAGVAIACSAVQTPGGGGINASNQSAQVITGSDGRFRLYVPYADTRKEMGDLIPPGSYYQIRVSAPGKSVFLPHSERIRNDGEARITLVRGTHYHAFRFVDNAGATIDPIPQGYEPFSLILRLPDGKRTVVFEKDFIRTGGQIPLGKLELNQYGNNAWKFQPMEITAASPPELIFVADARKTYTGRVAHAVTGQGLPGILVFAQDNNSAVNIADISPEQWHALHALPPAPSQEEPVLQSLKEMLGLRYAARTGPDGAFRIDPSPTANYYGFIAVEENFLAYSCQTGGLKPDEKGNVRIPNIPLFPAARMLVKITGTSEGDLNPSFRPLWILDKETTAPAWTANLTYRPHVPWEGCVNASWLAAGERKGFLMPACVKYQILFEASGENSRSIRFDRVFQPRQGETIDLGEVSAEIGWAALVRVAGPDGAPLEGIPVRRGAKHSDGIMSYRVAHNTDKNGVAQFYVEPGTEGVFAVNDFEEKSRNRLTAEVPYSIPPNPTEIPVFTIRLTQEQVDALLGKASGPAVATPSL